MSAGDPGSGADADGAEIARTLARVDHLVLATPDVDDTADRLATRLGVRAVAGGRHPNGGTRNALVALGDLVYLEIVGPDPEGPPPEGPRAFGIDTLDAPRLVTWVVRGRELEALAARARAEGVDLGDVHRRTRRRPDGVLLSWAMTDAAAPRADGVIPFFIDWGVTPHPAASSPRGGALTALRAHHPDPAAVRAGLRSLGLAIEVAPGGRPELIATLETPRGTLELR